VSALAQKHGARYIIASNDHEVRALAMCAEKFKRCGVTINAMTSNVLSYLDKLETSNLFSAAGVPTPKVLTAVNPPLPYVVRKRLVGSGRKYTHIVRTVDEENVLSFFPDASIITECLSGDEYTVDVLAHQGFMVAAVPRLRREVRNGMVHFGEVVKDYKVLNWTQHMVGQLKFDGIYCVQCIKNKDGCFFFEVNPRPGSGIDLSTAAGVNMPLLWLMSQEGNKFSAPEPVWGTKMVRYSSGYYFR
jgi:predicted ATP-grasp superfamily ATP-dependent carboligase